MTYPSGKLVLAQVQDAIYDWIKNEVEGVIEGDHIIWRQQSEPLPARPCVTIKITDGPSPTGLTDNLMYRQADQFTLGGQRTLTVSIQVFGNLKVTRPMAYQTVVDLHSSLARLTVLDRLRAAGVAVQERGSPTNITALEETEYEERAQFDVRLGVAQNVVDDPGVIEQANITPDISGP